jgi:F0F1-type ATP synthase membrane subunit b/b'
MDEQDMLRHLLEVESDAAALVHDAQSEADRRVAENEKEHRSRFDNRYEKEVSLLEKDYQEAIVKVKADYDKDLNAYRESFQNENVNNEAFVKIAESFLFKGK